MNELERIVFAQVYALELRAGRVALAKDARAFRDARGSLELGIDVEGPSGPSPIELAALHRNALERASSAVTWLRVNGSHPAKTGSWEENAARDLAPELKKELARRARTKGKKP